MPQDLGMRCSRTWKTTKHLGNFCKEDLIHGGGSSLKNIKKSTKTTQKNENILIIISLLGIGTIVIY
jgi:hypothetical protein